MTIFRHGHVFIAPLIICNLLLATSATAQISNPPNVAGQIAAAVPVCVVPPAPDTYTGSVGTQPACMPPQDASRATQVQTTNAQTASDGGFAGNWAVPFATAPQYAHAEINSATSPFVCQVTTATSTSYSGKCFQVASTTLPGTLLALNGLVVSPVVSATSGLTVKIIARQ